MVLIALDGISVEGFQKANTPNLDALLKEGVLSIQTRVVMPSVTLPNWTSHLTGSGPEQHGIVDNGWEINKKKFPSVETDADGYYPSVFKVLKDKVNGMKTAFYYNWINLFHPHNKAYFDEVSYLENDAYLPNYDSPPLYFCIPYIQTMRDTIINGSPRSISNPSKKQMSR